MPCAPTGIGRTLETAPRLVGADRSTQRVCPPRPPTANPVRDMQPRLDSETPRLRGRADTPVCPYEGCAVSVVSEGDASRHDRHEFDSGQRVNSPGSGDVVGWCCRVTAGSMSSLLTDWLPRDGRLPRHFDPCKPGLRRHDRAGRLPATPAGEVRLGGRVHGLRCRRWNRGLGKHRRVDPVRRPRFLPDWGRAGGRLSRFGRAVPACANEDAPDPGGPRAGAAPHRLRRDDRLVGLNRRSRFSRPTAGRPSSGTASWLLWWPSVAGWGRSLSQGGRCGRPGASGGAVLNGTG